MKRPLKLSLAIAFALGAADAFALGLGAIQVRSGLNQPLVAEIPVIQGTPGEAEGLIVQLASADDFDRVGLNRSNVGVPLQFSLAKNARGETVIRVTSQDIVREPFLNLLLEANWPKGRLLREYAVLLDPPVMAPAVKGSSAIAAAAAEPERAASQPLPASKPAPAVKPATPAPVATAAPRPPRPAAAPRTAAAGEYGPVAAGETLSEVARATRPDDNVSVNQMMLALLKANPNAFYRDNINALKRGAVLRIPSAEEVGAVGSVREAAAAVRAQVDEWRGGAAAAPTLVADTTPAPATAAATKPASSPAPKGERLALVPPREGKAGDGADRPSGGTSSGGDAATKAELSRVREALTSREQETGELKSRVKDLEDIKGKNERLISLQNSELAELRDKLKAVQDGKAETGAKPEAAKPTTPAATPATATTATPAATTPPASSTPITKEDIWGNGDAASKPAATASTTPPPAGTTPVDTAAPSTPTAATATPPADPLAKPATDAAAPSTPPPPAAEATAPVAAPAVTPPAATPKPDTAAKPATPAKKPTPAPVVAETPWYLEPWALGAGGVAGLLLVLLGILGLRKRKAPAPTAERASIADGFGAAPVAGGYVAALDASGEEQALIDQLRRDPSNAGAHLELLSLYYAQRDASKFEAAAEEMYASIADPNQMEWREARSMGEELVPHNPLFGGASDLNLYARGDAARAPAADDFRFDEPSTATTEIDYGSYRFDDPLPEAPAPLAPDSSLETAQFSAVEYNFDAPKTPAKADAEDSFSFDDLPPIAPADAPREVTEFDLDDKPEPVANVVDEDFFSGDDAVGTKLDLAKAYLDMGDPEGARAMLDEVLAEGSPLQQAEARKLIAEIR